MSILGRTRNLLTVLALGSVGAVAVPAGQASAAVPCSQDCITSVTFAQSLQDKARLSVRVDTTVPANVKVSLFANGVNAASMSDLAGSFTNVHHLSSGYVLNQGIQFNVVVTATGQGGNSRTETYFVRSLSRSIVFKATQVVVSEDSDVGAGEIKAGFRVAGQVSTVFGERSITAVKTLPLDRSMTAVNVPKSSLIYVELVDNDVDFGEWCPGGTAFSFTSGSSNCYDWTTGNSPIWYLSETPGTNTKTWSVTGNGRLKFTMSGTLVETIA